MASCFLLGSAASAEAETRTLKLYFIHTKERAEITFKKNGRYVQSGLNEINRFLRDWRRNEPAKMDPRLLDLVWEVYRAAGARDYIHVVSAYRSPATNQMLRSRSSGVAEKSQHMLGKAMDFYIPGVPLAKLRQAAFKAHGGGVGYYPKSGAPFVHLDVGNVRSWPRMSRSELLALFPDGKTIHIPTDGKPLPGFNQALAEYKSGSRSRAASVQVAAVEKEPEEKRQGFFARLFGAGGGADADEDSAEDSIVVASAPVRRTQPAAPAAAAAAAPLPGVTQPAPAAVAPAAPPAPVEPTPETILASLPARSIPVPVAAPRPAAAPVVVAAAAAPAPAAAAPAGPQMVWQRGPDGIPSADISADRPANVALADTLFGDAGRQPADERPVALALVAPVPTGRPAAAPQQVAAAEAPARPGATAAQAASGAVAAATATSAADIIASVTGQPAARQAAAPSATLAAFLPLPGSRAADNNDLLLAALPRNAARPTTRDEAQDRAVAQDRVDERLARLAAAPVAAPGTSPRLAVLGRDSGLAPEAAMAPGVRTTSKGAKPGQADRRPDPRAVRIPVPQQVARWALSNQPILMDKLGTTPPSFAHAMVHSAPAVVYTDGFHTADVQANANRFTGKAVSFMSVARFETN